MDLFDEDILNALKDGKHRTFNQPLTQVDFSLNTLRQHIEALIDKGLILKKKNPAHSKGRPSFTHSMPLKSRRQASFQGFKPGVSV